LIDPGTGGHTIQFLPDASADTLVLHSGAADQVTGFDPSTDILDFHSLLTESGVALNGDFASLGSYVTITDQGTDSLVTLDPAGHGGGGTVAVLGGLGGTVTRLDTLISQNAVRIRG
jgi:hypothetical protein